MSAAGLGVRVVPRAGFEPVSAGARTDPFISFLGFESVEDTPGYKLEKLQEQTQQQVAQSLQTFGFNLGAGIAKLFGVKAPRPAPTPEPATPPKTSGGSDDTPAARPPQKGFLPGFRTSAKIAAAGAATAGGALAINEAAKQLGPTINDAVDTTGKVVENAAASIGKGVDAATNSVRETLQPIFDIFGIADPETQKSISKLLITAGLVGAGLLTLYLVVKFK